MKAIILCAGYATRLYPLTLNKPKALLSIKGKPLLSYTLKKIDSLEEIEEVLIITNEKFYNDFLKWKNTLTSSKKIKIINNNTNKEEERLGMVGDLAFVLEKERINEDVLLILGDNLFNFDLKELMNFFNKHKSSVLGVRDVKSLEESKKFGNVKIKDEEIIFFEEKPKNPSSTFAVVGTYVLSKSVLENIKKTAKEYPPNKAAFLWIPNIMSFHKIYGFELKGLWYDIGDKETYDKVNNSWSEEI